MPQVFGCPNCQNPFQVPDNAAGQAFQCPTCKMNVEVPEEVGLSKAPQDADVFSCPHCTGKFGVDETMYGQKLACPHCDELVAIGEVPQEIAPPSFKPEIEQSVEAEAVELDANEKPEFEPTDQASAIQQQETPEAEQEEQPPPAEPVFEPQPVDHLLPPRFDIPDPKRFPTRLGSDEVILPDGDGGYRAVDANIVTITHNGQLYHLKRLTPEQRRRRKRIHNTLIIGFATLLIYLTLRTLGVLS